jgi:hypothetical protein
VGVSFGAGILGDRPVIDTGGTTKQCGARAPWTGAGAAVTLAVCRE